MRFLDNFDFLVKRRGQRLYCNNNINFSYFEDSYTLKGNVIDESNRSYDVTLNLMSPNNSTCSCKNGKFCEHMVAVFLANFPEERAELYENLSFLEEDDDYYEDEDDYDYEYDDYEEDDDSDYGYFDWEDSKFNVDNEVYNMLLNKYIDSLTFNELKAAYMKTLNIRKIETFNMFLKKDYQELLNKEDSEDIVFFEKLKNHLRYFYFNNFDNQNFNDKSVIFDDKSLKFISSIYQKEDKLRHKVEFLILNPSLFVYEDYMKIINIFKCNWDEKRLNVLANHLRSYFNNLKSKSIQNSDVKSNVLILLYELSNKSFDIEYEMLNPNLKYTKFVEYLINNTKNINDLFNKFRNKLFYRNNHYVADAYNYFYNAFKNRDNDNAALSLELYHFYEYLRSFNDESFEIIKKSKNWKYYYDIIIESNNKDFIINALIKADKKKELLNYCFDHNVKFDENIVGFLKDEYHEILSNYFIGRFYYKLDQKQYDDYSDLFDEVLPLTYLDNAYKYINDFIKDLFFSKYDNAKNLSKDIKSAFESIMKSNL